MAIVHTKKVLIENKINLIVNIENNRQLIMVSEDDYSIFAKKKFHLDNLSSFIYNNIFANVLKAETSIFKNCTQKKKIKIKNDYFYEKFARRKYPQKGI